MKNLGVVILINLLMLGLPVTARYLDNVPRSTLEIAKNFSAFEYPKDFGVKIVRVGIGSQNFSSYEWNKVSIYGTSEFEIYNSGAYLTTLDGQNVVNISKVGKYFVLTDSQNKVIAKILGPVVFKTEYGHLGISNLTRGGRPALYRGKFEIVPSVREDKFHVVNTLGLEDYLKGVVPNEMPVKFGLEALKAQTVAARNYALSPRIKSNPNYDVVDSVASQVYFGFNTENEISNQAVEETTGVVAIHDWNLFLAQYSSTAGGYTESSTNTFSEPYTRIFPSKSKPYLMARPDYKSFGVLNKEEDASKFYKSSPQSFDMNSPYYRWTREWNGQELQDAIQANIANQSAAGFVSPEVKKGEVIGLIKKINVLERGSSGKIIKLEIQTDKGNYTVEKELVIRRLFTCKGKALPSANVVFEQEYNNKGQLIYVKAYGGGFGHGVGLSQYGAGFMANELGKTYADILQHYYTDISLTTNPFILSSNNSQNEVQQIFYTKNKKAYLVIDNKFKVNSIDININNIREKIVLSKIDRFNRIDISKYIRHGYNTITFYYPLEQGSNKGLRIYVELAGVNEYSDWAK